MSKRAFKTEPAPCRKSPQEGPHPREEKKKKERERKERERKTKKRKGKKNNWNKKDFANKKMFLLWPKGAILLAMSC